MSTHTMQKNCLAELRSFGKKLKSSSLHAIGQSLVFAHDWPEITSFVIGGVVTIIGCGKMFYVACTLHIAAWI